MPKNEKSLATNAPAATDISVFRPEDFSVLGFSEERTVKIGDPTLGGIVGYIGELLGPGSDIPVVNNETGEVGNLKTFQAHPLSMGTLEINRSITDRVIAPYALFQSWTRIYDTSKANGTVAISGAIWQGKEAIQGGKKMVNKYRIFEKYLASGEKLDANKIRTAEAVG